MAGIVESRVRRNVYAVCAIHGVNHSEQACRDIADEFLIWLSWRVLGSGAERMIPAAFTLEWSDKTGLLHAMLRRPERVSFQDFSHMFADEWQKAGWGRDITISVRDARCVKQAVTHGLDTFLITT
jgi:hypothetical protein